MAKLIGVVSKVLGQVFAVASDGTRRALVEGDRLFAGEQLETGATGAVAVHLQNGAELTLGRESSLHLSSDLLAKNAPPAANPDAAPPSQDQLTDVEQIQKAIAAGGDPTQDAEATAAGPGSNGSAAGGGHSFVMLSEVGGRIDPIIGFPTAGMNGTADIPDRWVAQNSHLPEQAAPPVVNNPVTLDGLAMEGGEVTADEANLPDGSAKNPGALTQVGTFSVNAPDGVYNLNVCGINVITGGVVSGVGQSITTSLGNILTITGYDPATGVVSYSYTLAATDNHPAGNGANTVSESIKVVASDTNGDVAKGSLDINVLDDVPKAIDDTHAHVARENLTTLTGNVFSNDVQGADRLANAITPGTYIGTYGTLKLAADGSYTYTLNTADPDYIALQGGAKGTETFTYTLRDADGDTSTADLVLKVHNNNDPVIIKGLDAELGELTVYEQNLCNGSDPDAAALTQSGTFTVIAADGLKTLTIGGINVIGNGVVHGFPQSIQTELGNTLTITGYNPTTGVVSYSYTLLDNEQHPNPNGVDVRQEHISVTATDSDGSTANGSLDVNIVDDVPKARADSTEVGEGCSVSGNVLHNDTIGADDPGSKVVVGVRAGGNTSTHASGSLNTEIHGTYGTLVMDAKGNATYHANDSGIPVQGGKDVFTYTIRDADGDQSTTTVTIDVKYHDDPVILKGLNVACGELTVYEQNLCNGSDPDAAALTQSGTFTVTAADGLQSLTVGGICVISNGVAQGFPQSIQTHLGNTLTITGFNPTTGVVSYSYTLLDNEKHPNGHGNNTLSEHFNVVATDTDGSSASGKLDVNIVDDVPKARADWAEVDEGQGISGNVLHNDTLGADDPGCNVVIGVRAGGNTSTHASGSLNTEVHGKYGTLTLDAQGNATYHANPDAVGVAGAKDVFTYTIRDADGDKSTTTITIDVQNACFDDRPQVISSERSVIANQVDSNVLLIIDVSGSMADDSGVRGLSRLELAKEAIGLLLDKYEGMGDVKVQIVTFSTHAQEQSSVWVSVAHAKDIISDLEPYGDTNYDAAADAGQDAFGTAGKIDGAQNIGYFFSDGIPTSGHAIGTKDEAQWKAFLEANDIKSYAIGLGEGSDSGKLNPLAYDGSTGTNTDSTVVTDLNALGQVLSGTVQGSPITGSLMSGGTFGADGGFIKSLIIDGTTYTYDPKGNGNTGSYSATGGIDKGTFDTATNTLNVKSSSGGLLQVDMDTGEFTYTPPKATGSAVKETFGFVASDNDGDLDSAQLVINVNANAAPVAGADHIITNLFSSQINVPVEALLANDSDANGDLLSATPTTFTTGWAAKGADFSVGTKPPTISFSGHGSTSSHLFKDLDRSDFKGPVGSMAAALIVSGYLGQVGATNGEDYITVDLAKGERLALSHDRGDNITMAWKLGDGSYHTIASGSDFLAEEGGRYTLHVSNVNNPIGHSNNAEAYKLTMTIDYSGADNTPDAHGTYSVSDGHNGSAVGDVTISYQAGHTLTGTAGADTLLAGDGDDILDGGDGKDVLSGGEGNDQLHGGNNDDLLIGGAGNDLIDGGGGSDTASYADAGSAVTVNLALAGQQNTIGAGLDTLLSVENLMGSSHDDTLTGNGSNNVINGGLGNDILDGLGADDLLIGGRGDDTLTGGEGSDVFLWLPGNTGHDRVTDFTPGTDRLDLSQLLQGENASSASLDDYLHFKVTGSGSDVVSTIEVSAVAGVSPTQTIDLAGVDLAAHYGVAAGAGGVVAAGADTATIISGMLNDHTLKVDTV